MEDKIRELNECAMKINIAVHPEKIKYNSRTQTYSIPKELMVELIKFMSLSLDINKEASELISQLLEKTDVKEEH